MTLHLKPVAPVPGEPLERLRGQIAQSRRLARAWAQTLAAPRRRDMAALFAAQALDAYRGRVAPGLTLSAPFCEPYGRLDPAIDQLAAGLGEDAAGLPLSEALHVLTGAYASLLAGPDRSALGAFYTPPALVERLLDLAAEHGVNWRTASVLDPASGGAAFLVPVVVRIREALSDIDPAFVLGQISSRVSGLEIDPYAAWLGQAAMEIALADLITASRTKAPVFIRVADTLDEPTSPKYDLVVGNPPYGRVRLTDEQRRRFAEGLYGHANLYGVFTDLALRWTRPGGVVAFLTPTSFLGGQYFSALRGLLAREAPPLAMDFIQDRSGVFEDVLQETVLTIYGRGLEAGRFQVHYLRTDGDGQATVVKNGAVALPKTTTAPWMAPREPAQSPLIAVAEMMTHRLSDWGYGVSTGPLVWNRFKSQLEDKPGRDARPLIWAEAVTTEGRFIHRADRRGHAPWFKVKRGDGWLVVNRACILVHRTTAKEQRRRLIAAELPQAFIDAHDGVVVENHLNMVRPTQTALVPPAAVAAVLNSRVVDQLFRCINGSVAVSASELEAIPLPAPEALAPVEALIASGASADAIDAAIAALYQARP